jgi:hypothetical protein
LSRKARNFFPEIIIRLYDKNSESDYFFFLHQNQSIFFSSIGNQNIFLEKNHNPPFKLNGRSLRLIQRKGRNCKIFKRDLRRAYRQLVIDPGDIHLMGYKGKGHIYFARVLTMGLRSAAYICMRTTFSIRFICQKDGIQILNYLDDLTGCEEERYSNFAFDFLGECVKQSRNFFISRLLIWLREISDKCSFCIPLDLKLDLLWWNKCLPLYNGVSIMLSEEFSSPDEILSVDACLLRCGGWMNDRYFHSSFPNFLLD